MEVSSHALSLGRVAGTSYEVAAVHQPVPGPPGLPRDHRRLLRGQGHAVHARATPGPGWSTSTTSTAGSWPPPRRSRCTTYSAGGNPAADWRATDVRVRRGRQRVPGRRPRRRRGRRVGRPARAVQRRQRAGRDRRPGRGRDRDRHRGGRGRRVPGRARAAGAGRGRPGLHRARRLLAQARARSSAVLDALRPVTPGNLTHRPGLRRRPGPGQAPADGRGRGRARRPWPFSPTTTRARRTRSAILGRDAGRRAGPYPRPAART